MNPKDATDTTQVMASKTDSMVTCGHTEQTSMSMYEVRNIVAQANLSDTED